MTAENHTTTALTPFTFTFETHEVRIEVDDQGEPWWVAKDVCAVLGIKNVSNAVGRLEQGEKRIRLTDNLLIINEAGLYRLVFRSDKPEVKRFQTWVFEEVLPQIRKTGGFSPPKGKTSQPTGIRKSQLLLQQSVEALMEEVEEVRATVETHTAELAAIKDRKPPVGKIRPEDWLRHEAKPYLNQEMMRLFRAACSRREKPAEFRPEGMDFPLRYYTPATIAEAYEEVMRQLILWPGDESLTRDPGVAYLTSKKKRGQR